MQKMEYPKTSLNDDNDTLYSLHTNADDTEEANETMDDILSSPHPT